MTARKKRRRPRAGGSPDARRRPTDESASRTGAKGSSSAPKSRAAGRTVRDRPGGALRTGRPRTAEERRALAAQWVHPPVAPTAARGLAAVGTSPFLLATSFLAALGLWLIFTAYGVVLAASPGAMVMLESLPPVHALFLDIPALLSGHPSSAAVGLAFMGGLLIVRAFLLAFWIASILDRLSPSKGHGRWRGSAVHSLRRALRAMGPMVGVEAGFLGLALASAYAVRAAIGEFVVIAALVGGLYFFVYAPIVVIAEGRRVRPAVRLAVKAARFPGPRHMMAAFTYLALSLFISVFTPASRVAEATPTIQTWIYVLFVSFLHLSALAMFTYRWLLIRERVLQVEEQRVGRPGNANAAGDKRAVRTLP